MRVCEKCGGLRATEPGGEVFAGTPCICIAGDSALELAGKERLTRPAVQIQSVAGSIEMTHADFQRACYVALTELIENPVGDNHIIHLLCEAVRCSRECCEIATSQANGFAAGERKGREQSDREAMTLDRVNYLCEKWERKGRIEGLREAAKMATENAAARNINWVALDINTKADLLEREAEGKPE